MKLFTTKRFTWWQIGLIKWSCLFIGIAAGAWWWQTFLPFAPILLAAGLVLGLVALYYWLKA